MKINNPNKKYKEEQFLKLVQGCLGELSEAEMVYHRERFEWFGAVEYQNHLFNFRKINIK